MLHFGLSYNLIIFVLSITTLTKTYNMSKTKKPSLQQLGLDFYNNRDERSFKLLHDRIRAGLSHYLREKYNCNDHQTREEILLKTFSNIWEKIEQYDPYYAFSTWAYRIARNEALQSMRYGQRNYSLDDMEEMGINVTGELTTTPDYEFFEPTIDEEMSKLYDIVVSEINNLSELYKIVLTETLLNNKKERVVSEETGMNINTIKTRKRKGRSMLFKTISSNHPELLEKYYK